MADNSSRITVKIEGLDALREYVERLERVIEQVDALDLSRDEPGAS